LLILPRINTEARLRNMSTAEILRELPKLQPEERRAVRAKLDELDGVADDVWIDGGELTEEEKAMLDARLADNERSPEAGSSWEEVEARLRKQLRG
jgi:putative addiction module component (TIGR02574 family)